MSLSYTCLFAGQSADLHLLLNYLIDEHLDEVPEDIAGDNVFCFFENNGSFSLYYVDDEDIDSKALLIIYPSLSRSPETYTLAFGDFKVQSSWFIHFDKRNISKADEALTRVLRGVLKQYEGDFVNLFNGGYIKLYRTGGHVYLNQRSSIGQEPLRSLLNLPEYTLIDL